MTSRNDMMRAAMAMVAAAMTASAAETMVFDQPECTGMSGFRGHWNRPVPVAEDGARLLKDNGITNRGQTAVWDGVKPGPLCFHAVHPACWCVLPARRKRPPSGNDPPCPRRRRGRISS